MRSPNVPVVKSVTAYPPLACVDDVDDLDDVTSIQDTVCRRTCAFGAAKATEGHHRILMRIETDQDVLLELFELAVTWPELDYSETLTIAPEDWMRLVESHRWADPDRVERIFSLATDIAMAAARAARQRSSPLDPP
jgi:hypothetical protein